jgi:hypothetical protein
MLSSLSSLVTSLHYELCNTVWRVYVKCTLFWHFMLFKKSAWPLKMGSIVCPETSVGDCHSTLHKIPKERISHLHRSGSQKANTKSYVSGLGFVYASYTQLHRTWPPNGLAFCSGDPGFESFQYLRQTPRQ